MTFDRVVGYAGTKEKQGFIYMLTRFSNVWISHPLREGQVIEVNCTADTVDIDMPLFYACVGPPLLVFLKMFFVHWFYS